MGYIDVWFDIKLKTSRIAFELMNLFYYYLTYAIPVSLSRIYYTYHIIYISHTFVLIKLQTKSSMKLNLHQSVSSDLIIYSFFNSNSPTIYHTLRPV